MRFTENAALSVATILYVGTLFTLSLVTETSIFIVFVSTLPILLYLIALFYLLKLKIDPVLLWVLPAVFPLIFLIIWYSKTFVLLNSTDGPVVAVVNIMISYVINIFVLLIIGVGKSADTVRERRVEVHHHHADVALKKEIEDVKQQLHHTKKTLDDAHEKLDQAKQELQEKKDLEINKENFNVTLRSIEDKCKAINFVLGRVYSDKRGASQEIRDKLRIDAELYNSFTEMTADFKEEEKHKLQSIIRKIYAKLLILEDKEEDLLQIDIGKLPIFRRSGDRILDVLARNDKDPITDYHKEAKEICEKMIRYLE